MNKTYHAVYFNSSGRFYNATIFISTITLSIRYTNEHNEIKDVFWLAENIVSLEEEALSSNLKYSNKSGETERLVIRDLELLQAIKKQFSHHRFVGGWKHHVHGSTRNKLLLVLFLFVLVILGGYLWLAPWLGERIARNVSQEWEISMGEKMHQSMMGQFKIDSVKTKLINDFYNNLRFRLDYPIQITVVKSKEVNAFAIPGGHIVVYNSIVNRMQKSEELASLLSHEASHIKLRHSLRNIFRSMARKMFLMMIIGNESGLAGFLVDNANNLKGLEFSRTLETEADNHGIRLMHTSNIDAGGMLRLMEILQEETMGKEPPAFLSTHPVFESRIHNIKTQIDASNLLPGKHESLDSIFAELVK